MLTISIAFMLLVLRWHRRDGENSAQGVDRDERLGGTALAAFRQVVQSPISRSRCSCSC